MVSLAVKFFGHFEHACGAKRDTKSAPFTVLDFERDLAALLPAFGCFGHGHTSPQKQNVPAPFGDLNRILTKGLDQRWLG
jgi:hypothetical protein